MPRKTATLRTAIVEPVAIDTAEAMPAQNPEVKRAAKKGSGSLDDLSRTALKAFLIALDLECARKVLQMDKDIDRVCHGLFQKHLTEQASDNPSSFDVILMAQALERAGDHTTNLAEDLYSLIEGRSLRHAPKKRAAT